MPAQKETPKAGPACQDPAILQMTGLSSRLASVQADVPVSRKDLPRWFTQLGSHSEGILFGGPPRLAFPTGIVGVASSRPRVIGSASRNGTTKRPNTCCLPLRMVHA